jgi:acyl-CoA thioester hydrolase
MIHLQPITVYYYDVDCNGVVYHGNYPKYMEQGRTEWLKAQGFDLIPLQQQGIFFAVASLNIQYKQPAFLQDRLQVATKLVKLGAASMAYEQLIQREGKTKLETLAIGHITLCCVNPELKPIRIPKIIFKGVTPT